jgi:hypothetical protein
VSALLGLGVFLVLPYCAVAASTETQASSDEMAAEAGSQHDFLAAAARGRYWGKFGTLEFRGDGTATFAIRNCSFTDQGPGRVRVDDRDCYRERASGSLTVGDHSYEIEDAAHNKIVWDAYVDDQGILHVHHGLVGYLGPTRTRTVRFPSSNIELEVGNGVCTERDTSNGTTLTKPCKFVRNGGGQLLIFRGIDLFQSRQQPTITRLGLVYLPKTGLLVEASLAPYSFKKSEP